MKRFIKGKCIYNNKFETAEMVKDWIAEGYINVSFDNEGIILTNELDPNLCGDSAHWTYWCPIDFKDNIIIEWDFRPLSDEGLCMMFFASIGRNGQSIFSETLPKRNGVYPQYHSGAINALHLSYYRRKYESERKFNTCNLRKSFGFNLVSMAADPIPAIDDIISAYHMKLIKYGEIVQLYIDDLLVLKWEDDGKSYGKILEGGKIGFRQMAPMKARYSNFEVHEAILEEVKVDE